MSTLQEQMAKWWEAVRARQAEVAPTYDPADSVRVVGMEYKLDGSTLPDALEFRVGEAARMYGEAMTPAEERTRFEAWVMTEPPYFLNELERRLDGRYYDSVIQWRWEAWQARAALDSAYRELPLSNAVEGEKEG